MGDELHKLFLFEFLVHSVTFSNSTLKLDMEFLKKLGPTCVQFKAKNLPSLKVSEIDFCAKDAFNCNLVKFKSGKSCLFSLGNSTINDCEIKGDVTVKRPLPPGCKSNSYCVGKSPVYLNNKFVKVLNSIGDAPASNCMKVCLDLKNSINETVGTARLLLRLTCFGTAIVTEFQKTADDSKGFLFKGDKIIPFEPELSAYGPRKESRFSNQQQGDARGRVSQSYAGMQQLPPMIMPGQMQQQQMGMQQPQMGMQQPQMGMQQPQMGMQQPQMGMQQPQMGMQQPQMGMQQPQMGMQQPQMGMQQPQMGMQQPQMGMQQPQMGMPQEMSMMQQGQMPMMQPGQMPMMQPGQMPMMQPGQMPMMQPGQMPSMQQAPIQMGYPCS